MNREKCLKYYFDSKEYSNEEIQKNIEETKKEFPKKKVKVDIQLNQFGVYVITFYFENKNTIWSRIKIYFKKKAKKPLLLQEGNKRKIENGSQTKNRLEKYYGRQYGKYKETKTYRPY